MFPSLLKTEILAKFNKKNEGAFKIHLKSSDLYERLKLLGRRLSSDNSNGAAVS